MNRQFRRDALVVSEIFGPTFQGEGPTIGRICAFLRLGHCNLQCSWCDTSYTWDWNRFSQADELTAMSIDQIAERIEQLGVPILVISGGEPLLQQEGLRSLLERLPSDLTIEIETNGTISPNRFLVQRVSRFNVSPKLAHASMSTQRRIRPRALEALAATGKATFKFVATSESDLVEIELLTRQVDMPEVFVMPEGREPDQVLSHMQDIAPGVLARGWNLTTRLHVLLWGDRRAV